MKLAEILTASRARLDDEVTPYRWSDSQLTSWINEANQEACRRTRYLVDNTQSIAIIAGTSQYDFPDDVIFIHRAKLASEDSPLVICSYKDLDETIGWQTHEGTPSHLLVDMSFEKFTLYPIPDANGTLQLVTINAPESLTGDISVPNRFGYAYIDWVMYRAYGISDIDKQDMQRSLASLAAFEAEFGPKSSAKDEIFNFRNRPFDNFDGNF